MNYQEEELTVKWVAEAVVLMDIHKREICAHDDFELDPDWESYFLLFNSEMLRVYTARDDGGDMVGYALFTVHQHLHFKQVLAATQDVLFMHPDNRGVLAGVRLISFADEQLTALGVKIVSHHVNVAHDFSPILERAGYVHVDNIYEKRLN